MFSKKNIFLMIILSAAFTHSADRGTRTLSPQEILDSLPKEPITVGDYLKSEQYELNPKFIKAYMILHVVRDGHALAIPLSPLEFVPEIKTSNTEWLTIIKECLK